MRLPAFLRRREKPAPKVHDLRRQPSAFSPDGFVPHGAFVLSVKDGGREITVSGFSDRRLDFAEGDYLLLSNGDGDTRYRIKSTSFPWDPNDQYFLRCEFAPRQVEGRKP